MPNEMQVDTREVDARARALAVLVAARGGLGARELAALRRLDAFRQIGVTADRFKKLAAECLPDLCHAYECSWIPASDETLIDALLDAVRDPNQRRLIASLAVAATADDGLGRQEERRVLDHALARWHIDRRALV